MPSLTVSRTIKAPIGDVWQVFTDLPSAPDRLSAVQSVEMLSDQPFGEGTRWRETRQMFGKAATEEMWVTHVHEPETYSVAAHSNGTHYESRYDFHPLTEGETHVSFMFSGKSEGIMRVIGALAWPLLRGKIAKDLRRDLDDLADFCETGQR
jgi:uncharacterized membrane protein